MHTVPHTTGTFRGDHRPERLAAFDESSIAELARRLDEDDYPTPFAGLSDWHLLRSLAIHRPELARPYVHLVDQEPFDED